jgi:hypothetical protein
MHQKKSKERREKKLSKSRRNIIHQCINSYTLEKKRRKKKRKLNVFFYRFVFFLYVTSRYCLLTFDKNNKWNLGREEKKTIRTFC